MSDESLTNSSASKLYRQVVNSQQEFKDKINSQIYDFSDSIFLSDIKFSIKVVQDNLDFVNCVFNWNVIFERNTYNAGVNFQAATFEKSAIFSDSIFRSNCNFWECKFIWLADFSDSSFEGLTNFTNSIFKNEWKFWRSNFRWEVLFINARFECTAYFGNTNFRNKISFILAYFQRLAYFDSSLFEEIPDIRFQFCKMINLDWVNFGKGVNFLGSNIEMPSNHETARVIKYEFQKLENQFETLSWHAKEMKAYHNWLRVNRDIFSNKNHYWFKRDKNLELNDEFILFFNWITNNHWLSWIRPIFWILIINLSFNLYLEFNYSNISFWPIFILTLNPVKSLKELGIDWFWNITNTIEAISFIKNVLIALLLYQLIMSFRKFSKKF